MHPLDHQSGLQALDVGRFKLGPSVGGGSGDAEATQEEGEPSHGCDGTEAVLPTIVGRVHGR